MITRFLLLFAFSLSITAQPFSPQDPVFSQICSPLLQGCVGYWRLEEASGVRYDLSGKNNNLTANNSPGQAAGKVGNCATFTSASSQSLSLASNSSLQTGNIDYTLAFWCKVTSTTPAGIIIAKDNGGTTGNREYESYYTTGNRFEFATARSGGDTFDVVTANTFGAITTGVWYFVVNQHLASGTNRISVNNSAFDSAATGGNPSATSGGFFFNKIGGASPFYGNSAIDEAGFWKRLLTDKEIVILYNAGLGTHFPWSHP